MASTLEVCEYSTLLPYLGEVGLRLRLATRVPVQLVLFSVVGYTALFFTLARCL